jgi:hypothetical protein
MDLTMLERVCDRWGKNGRIWFDRPKPTVGCSASGRRRRRFIFHSQIGNCVSHKISIIVSSFNRILTLISI